MQISVYDLEKLMLKLSGTDPVNRYRKLFGNLKQCLKSIENPFFLIDNTVIKLKDKDYIDSLFKEQKLDQKAYNIYLEKYISLNKNAVKILIRNYQNKCKMCG